VVLDVLERRVVGQVLEELAYFVLGCFQLDLPNCTLPRLKATGQSVCPLGAARAGRLVVSVLRITFALTGRGERMRASGPVERDVRRRHVAVDSLPRRSAQRILFTPPCEETD
jgi:hypothetical protein